MRIVLMLALLMPGAMAGAADHRPPPLRLAEDVAIHYRQSFAGLAGEAVTLIARSGVIRDEQRSGDDRSITLIDPQRRLLIALDPATRSASLTPQTEEELRTLLEGGSAAARFASEDEEEIAGIPCRNWHVEEPDGTERDLCVSAEGLLLRLLDGALQLEAVRVSRGALDPAFFRIPPGWTVTRADGGPVPADLPR